MFSINCLRRKRAAKRNPALTAAYQERFPSPRGPENNILRVAPFLFLQYIARILSRVRNSRGRPINALPPSFILAESRSWRNEATAVELLRWPPRQKKAGVK
jgi:hypothetical protein